MSRFIMTAIVSALAFACGDLPDPTVNNTPVPSDQQQTQSLKPQPPTVSTTSSSWGYSSIPIRGKAEKDATIIVEGGAALSAAEVRETGSFCVDVLLKEGANELRMFAQRVDDSRSDTVRYRVAYDPALADDDDEAPPQATTGTVRDIARGRAVASSVAPQMGGNTITDGQDNTSAYWNASYYPSVYIDLGATHAIERIELLFAANATAEGSYADQYDIFTSLQTSPTVPPDQSTPGWSLVASVNGASGGNGDGDGESFAFGTPVSARWVAVTIYSNDTFWWYDKQIYLASFEVYAPEVLTGGGSDIVGPPTCENGG